jgi:TusA-related sulfurtransferase
MMDTNTNVATKQILDNRGSNCAAGFFRLLEIMEGLAPGESLTILSTDAAAHRELKEWTGRAGHILLKVEKTGPLWKREYHFQIQKGINPNNLTQGDSR